MNIDFIDKGKTFDWGKTSENYAKYRDIYPKEFYDYILNLGLCKDGQKVLDLGAGTGVLPRNMNSVRLAQKLGYEYSHDYTVDEISL